MKSQGTSKAGEKGSLVIPILNNEYKVIVCWGDPKYVEKVIKDWHHDKADVMLDADNMRGRCYYKKDCHPIVAMPSFPRTPAQIGTLAHEAVHAVSNIFDMIQEYQRDEVYAHSVGAVVREVLKVSK